MRTGSVNNHFPLAPVCATSRPLACVNSIVQSYRSVPFDSILSPVSSVASRRYFCSVALQASSLREGVFPAAAILADKPPSSWLYDNTRTPRTFMSDVMRVFSCNLPDPSIQAAERTRVWLSIAALINAFCKACSRLTGSAGKGGSAAITGRPAAISDTANSAGMRRVGRMINDVPTVARGTTRAGHSQPGRRATSWSRRCRRPQG